MRGESLGGGRILKEAKELNKFAGRGRGEVRGREGNGEWGKFEGGEAVVANSIEVGNKGGKASGKGRKKKREERKEGRKEEKQTSRGLKIRIQEAHLPEPGLGREMNLTSVLASSSSSSGLEEEEGS